MKIKLFSLLIFLFGMHSTVWAVNGISTASAGFVDNSPAKNGVEESIYYYPREVIFWNVAQGSDRKKTIFIRQGDQHPLNILDVKSENKNIGVGIVGSGGKDRKIFSVDVHLLNTVGSGSMEGVVKILTDHPLMPELAIPVFWNVLADMVVDPPAFGVRLTRGKRQVGGVIKIASTSGEKFSIDKVDALLPGVKTDIRPMEECCGYYLAVLVSDPEFKFRRSQESSLVIHTSHEQQQMLVVPMMVTAPDIADPPKVSAP